MDGSTRRHPRSHAAAALGLSALFAGCSGGVSPGDSSTPAAATEASTAPRPELSDLGAALFAPVTQPWTGDLDAMVERRAIRALVVPTRTQYWIEDGRPVGVEYELLKAFEQWLNRRYRTGHRHLHVHIVFIPTRRDDLIPALREGRGDLAAGMLTITEDRLQEVDFSSPFFRDVREVPVTDGRLPALESVDDLGGKTVYVRRSASYWSHLNELNLRLAEQGRPLIRIETVSELLTDDDLLEMVNAGLSPMTVVDRYLAAMWQQVFTDLQLHEKAYVNEGGQLAWMMRQGSTGLKAAIDEFARTHRQGTLFGNYVREKYTGSDRFIREGLSGDDLRRFRGTVGLFQKYGEKYALDPLLLLAQGYQESRLRQQSRSPAGAIGVMQLLPTTGAAMNVGDITRLEPNIHAGAKYVRRLIDRYFADPEIDPLNRTLFAFAAYNAGPVRVQALRRRAAARGLNPNAWLNNVELIAAEQIGSETVSYVANIYKYYVAYTLTLHAEEERLRIRDEERSADASPRRYVSLSRPPM